MGMTPEQFWDMDCSLVVAYREAYRIRMEQQNRAAWLQGMYIYEALCDVAPVLRAFSKASRPRKYSEKPYEFGYSKKPDTKEKKESQQNQGLAWMETMASRINRNLKRKQVEEHIRQANELLGLDKK